MKRVLVTGGAGFIGSHVVEALLKQGDEVSVIDNFDPFYPERLKRRALWKGARLFENDIRDQDAMHAAFKAARPEIVIHLAALAGVRPSLERPAAYMDVNVRGTACILEAAREAGTRRFILGSSSSVYGPRQRPDLAIHKFSRKMLARQPIPFFGDGSSRRDYTYIDDIVQGVLAACDAPLTWDVINLGGAHTTSLKELVQLLEETLQAKAILDRQPAQPGDVPLTSADLAHAGKVLGYAPRTPIREGLKKFAEWLAKEGRDWV